MKKRNKRLQREFITVKNKVVRLSIVTLVGVAMLILLCLAAGIIHDKRTQTKVTVNVAIDCKRPEIVEAFLTPNEYSRPQTPLNQVNGVVIHYIANPGTTGWENQHYFENLKDTHTTKVSSHFIIGLDGTIIQCIPLNEISYASNERNGDTISIECCHPKVDGKFTKETYHSLVTLTAWLAGRYYLEDEDILRHFDVTGKNCPKYFVEHEDKWEKLKKNVWSKLENWEKAGFTKE
ncbi:MAG: N-acetylmuramoyl-L-alanine amidase family protein [Velocimicrobium sp.]